jgi:hypothetical protein
VPTEAEITARARANVEARDRLSGESDAQYKMRQQRGKVGGSIEARERRAVAYQQKLEAEENKLRNVASDRLKELTLADTEVRKAELMRDAAEGTITAKFMQRLKKDAADRLEKYVEANRVTQSNAWGNAAASAMFEKEKIELGDSNAETLRKPILAMFNDYTKGYEGGLEFIQILDSQGVHPLDMYNNRELLHYVAKRGFKDTHMEILLSALLSGKTSVLRADWEL